MPAADITLVNLNMLFMRYGEEIERELHVPLGCLYLTRALEDAGWRVEVAEDGIAALGRISRVHPDVVLMDLGMPNLDGGTALEILRARGAEGRVPVIVTTGARVDASVRRLADRVLEKPFDRKDLLEAVSSAAGVTRSRRR